MNLDTFTTILVAIVPALTAFATMLGCVIKIINLTKGSQKKSEEQIEKKTLKMEKSFNDIAKIEARLKTIEDYIIEEKEKRGGK